MKRSGLRRRTALRVDPEKAAAWRERRRDALLGRALGREGMASSLARARVPLEPSPPTSVGPDQADGAPSRAKRKAKRIPPGVRTRVLARSQGRCVMCVHRLRAAGRTPAGAARAVQLHHVLPKGEGKWPEFAQEEDNLIGLCPRCHYSHEFPGVNGGRIPLAALPECVVAFVAGRGLAWYLERAYS